MNRHLKNLVTDTRRMTWLLSFLAHGFILSLLVYIAPKFSERDNKKNQPLSAALVFKHRNSQLIFVADDPIESVLVKPIAIRSDDRKNNGAVRKNSVAKNTGFDDHGVNDSASDDGALSEHANDVIAVRKTPLLINKADVKIPYPEQARQMMIEGNVKMRLTVSEEGSVIDAQIVSGPYYGLRNAALSVARKLFFLPATDENGHARIAQIDHEVVFRLHKRS